MKFRKLKIYPKAQQRTSGYVIVPEIRLQGRWLEHLGFKEGKMLKVETNHGKLIISVIEGEEDS